MSYWIAANILLSAATYLLDFISNIIVAVEYGTGYAKLLGKSPGECNEHCKYSKKAIAGYFWTLLGILLLSHTANALIFKFKFNPQDHPFKSAYFLPLIHLWRMGDVMWRTFSFERLKDVRPCKYMNGLFAILGTALEGLPILIIQFSAFQYFSSTGSLQYSSLGGHKSVFFKISIAASFLAAGYTGGSSTLTLADNARSTKAKLGIGISSGLFTVLASLARCVTLTTIIVYIPEYYFQARSLHSRVQFHLVDTLGAIFGAGSIIAYWFYYWILQHPNEVLKNGYLLNSKKCLACLVLGYMSFVAGPMYPMVSEARDRGKLGTFKFQARLFVLSVLNIGADMSVVIISHKIGALPNVYLLSMSLGAALGYLVAIATYIAVDIHCGSIVVPSHSQPSDIFYDPEQSDNSAYFDALSVVSL